MVRAILDGRKTQTRRVIKPQPEGEDLFIAETAYDWTFGTDGFLHGLVAGDHGYEPLSFRCPYGIPGERLWVRETWQAVHTCPESGIRDDFYAAGRIPAKGQESGWAPIYAATDPSADYSKEDRGFSWRPSIFMPRWASRIFLEITDVRVERLQSITPEDCRAEGHKVRTDPHYEQRDHDDAGLDWYEDLWIEINGLESWRADPLVWVISFKKLKP